MRKSLLIIFSMLFLLEISSASTRGDVTILEATENIQYLGQKIAKDYFFFYKNPEDVFLKEQLNKNIDNLQHSINEIIDIIDNTYDKSILIYLRNRAEEEIKELINQETNLDNARSVLGYSETMLEVNSIAKKHKYEFSQDEKMLMTNKEVQYLLEKATKYYMVSQIGLGSDTNFKNLKDAITNIDNHLLSIESYNYPENLKLKLKTIKKVWSINRDFFEKSNELSIPHLLLNSTQYIETLLKEIEQYHKKNL